jgi:hypothetical protein
VRQQQHCRRQQQHDMFPNLQSSRPAYAGQSSKFGRALSGASRQVPNPADWVARKHNGAPPSTGELQTPGVADGVQVFPVLPEELTSLQL